MTKEQTMSDAELIRRWLAALYAEGIAKNQREAAGLLGVSAQTLTNWRSGVSPVSVPTRLAMSAVLARLNPYEPEKKQ